MFDLKDAYQNVDINFILNNVSEYDIWIVHFAVSRDNQVPSFFKSRGSKTARDTYLPEMKIKRSTHAKNKTRLIETYSYEAKEGIIFENLKKQLGQLKQVNFSNSICNNGKNMKQVEKLLLKKNM